MKKSKPSIDGPERHDFHDSALMGFEISRDLRTISVELEIGYGRFRGQLWRLTFSQVLSFEFETIGLGIGGSQPVDVHDVYRVTDSEQIKRWEDKLIGSGTPKSEARCTTVSWRVVIFVVFIRGRRGLKSFVGEWRFKQCRFFLSMWLLLLSKISNLQYPGNFIGCC
ncbi:MAG: hypothetical protein IPN95_30155 [Bacteroidetes bacterium]|nr:hypothetical protein [Bacteroidota bacterium]